MLSGENMGRLAVIPLVYQKVPKGGLQITTCYVLPLHQLFTLLEPILPSLEELT